MNNIQVFNNEELGLLVKILQLLWDIATQGMR